MTLRPDQPRRDPPDEPEYKVDYAPSYGLVFHGRAKTRADLKRIVAALSLAEALFPPEPASTTFLDEGGL